MLKNRIILCCSFLCINLHAHFTTGELDFFTRFYELSQGSKVTPFEVMAQSKISMKELQGLFTDLEHSLQSANSDKIVQRKMFKKLMQLAITRKLDKAELAMLVTSPEALKTILDSQQSPGLTIGKISEAQVRKLLEKYESKKPQIPSYTRERIEMEFKNITDIDYLNLLIDLPWNRQKQSSVNLTQARIVLDQHHTGLEKVKSRIIEHLAVQRRVGNAQSPILCLIGPPGAGKTTIAKSIAKSINRPFASIPLGGVADEGTLRGVSRSYKHPSPSKVIKAIRKTGYSNPVIMLDEIDKLSGEHTRAHTRGDPSAVLLEILDKEQNTQFQDDYLDVPYDLSKVMFIATANYEGRIPAVLRDRLEIIRLSGYTREEKLVICKNHLIPKQLKSHALNTRQWQITDEAIEAIISSYTFEAGVRGLERIISSLMRKAILILDSTPTRSVKVTLANLSEYLDAPRHEINIQTTGSVVGQVHKLSVISTSGEGHVGNVQVVLYPSSEGPQLSFTGNLNDKLIEESGIVAFKYIKSKSQELGLDADTLKRYIHIHHPGEALKEGSSSGSAITLAILSALLDNPVHQDIAMTGTVDALGNVGIIGGLKEKLLAARRQGIKKVFVPFANKADIEAMSPSVTTHFDVVEPSQGGIPDPASGKIKVIYVRRVEDILPHALTQAITPLSTSQ